MSKSIHCNVAGIPSDVPHIFDDAGGHWGGVFNATQTRCSFTLPDQAVGGGHLRWTDHNVNFLLPLDPGSYEGASLGLPTITYVPPIADVWPMKGATEFNLPAKMRAGEDIRPILQQRKAAGATCVRSLAMGYPFRTDQQPLTLAQAAQYWGLCADAGLRVLWCVFAGTRLVMSSPSQQQQYWEDTKATAAAHPTVLLQLANEWNHGSQSIDPSQFAPSSVNLCDHGPGLTDAHPVEPFWSFVSWHARRDGTRGITNCDCYEFEADPWPRAQPWIVGESAKPENYGFNPEYARQMGAHCGLNWGGIFHSGEGVESKPWPANVESCALAFYGGIDGR